MAGGQHSTTPAMCGFIRSRKSPLKANGWHSFNKDPYRHRFSSLISVTRHAVFARCRIPNRFLENWAAACTFLPTMAGLTASNAIMPVAGIGIDRSARPIQRSHSASCSSEFAPLWESGSIPTLERRLTIFTQFAADMAAIGPANILYSDGDVLFVHGHRRTQADGRITPPGLWRLSRQCEKCRDIVARDHATSSRLDRRKQEVMLFASIPLSDEDWVPLVEGEVLAIRHGRLLDSAGARNFSKTKTRIRALQSTG